MKWQWQQPQSISPMPEPIHIFSFVLSFFVELYVNFFRVRAFGTRCNCDKDKKQNEFRFHCFSVHFTVLPIYRNYVKGGATLSGCCCSLIPNNFYSFPLSDYSDCATKKYSTILLSFTFLIIILKRAKPVKSFFFGCFVHHLCIAMENGRAMNMGK